MITIDLIGRLGNQLFQYAVCRTVAEKNGYQFYIPKNKNDHGQNISDFFNLEMGLDDGSPMRYLFAEDHTIQKYNPNILNISDYTKIWGFYQTDKYFINNEKNVKEWFSIINDDKTKDILEKYPVDEYCYIHFRGGDYKDWEGGKYFLPKKYYDDSINYIKSLNDNLKFLIITDDVELAKEFFDFDIVSNDMMVDFKLIYNSKYCIIPNSTFSWWAAWLNTKEVTIAPNFWLNYNHPQLGFYPYDIKSDKFKYL